jgi:hypothetical protein
MQFLRDWLIGRNPSSGKAWWWVSALAGYTIVLVYMAAALPWFGLYVHWTSLGDFVRSANGETGMLVYRRWSLSGPVADRYFFTILLGIVPAKLALLIGEISIRFARGRHYHLPKPGHRKGYWTGPH